MNLGKPIAEGEMSITSITVAETHSTLSTEGDVGDYGRVFATYNLFTSDDSRTSGTFEGSARALNADGEMISASLQGIYRRTGGTLELHSLDLATNGDRNFVTAQIDIVAKTSNVAVYSL